MTWQLLDKYIVKKFENCNIPLPYQGSSKIFLWGSSSPTLTTDVKGEFNNVCKSDLCLSDSSTKEIEAIWTDVISDWG